MVKRILPMDIFGGMLMNQVSSKPDPNTHKCIQAGSLDFGKWANMHEISRRYYSTKGVAPTIHTSGGAIQNVK